MGFPERLESIIQERHISKYKIAKAIDISASTVSNYIKGKTKPDPTKLAVLSNLLGVSKTWLQTGEGPKYIVEEPAIAYTPTAHGVNEKEMIEKLLILLDRQSESMREKDQQISILISKIPSPAQQS